MTGTVPEAPGPKASGPKASGPKAPDAKPAKTDKASRSNQRAAARLAAVQALYQMDLSGGDLGDVLAEYEAHRLGQEVEGDVYSPADAGFFRDIVAGVVREQRGLDKTIDSALAAGWPLARLDATLRAILRGGVYELSFRPDVPPKAAINEYVEVGHAFYEGDEMRMINGVLDRIARDLHPDAMGPKRTPRRA